MCAWTGLLPAHPPSPARGTTSHPPKAPCASVGLGQPFLCVCPSRRALPVPEPHGNGTTHTAPPGLPSPAQGDVLELSALSPVSELGSFLRRGVLATRCPVPGPWGSQAASSARLLLVKLLFALVSLGTTSRSGISGCLWEADVELDKKPPNCFPTRLPHFSPRSAARGASSWVSSPTLDAARGLGARDSSVWFEFASPHGRWRPGSLAAHVSSCDRPLRSSVLCLVMGRLIVELREFLAYSGTDPASILALGCVGSWPLP